jgi:hypothetical protein
MSNRISEKFEPHLFLLGPNHEVLPVRDLYEWAQGFEAAERHVAQTTINSLRVSTIFLGLDYSRGHGPPLFFETMIFKDERYPPPEPPEVYFKRFEAWRANFQNRYTTWDEARKGHELVVTIIREGLF